MLTKPTVTEGDLARLKEERDHADRLYNDALTALDAALTAPKPLPAGAASPDTSRIQALGQLWQILPPEPVPYTGWRRRLGGFVWRMVAPMLQRQQEFNAALLDHHNRTAASARASADASAGLLDALTGEFAALATLQSRLIQFLQQVTLYVDSKDRFETGLLWHELRARTEGLAAGLSALGDELMKGREHALVAERRLQARVAEGLAWFEQNARGRAGVVPPTNQEAASSPLPATADVLREQLATEAGAGTYAGFEDQFRGPVDEIGDRVAEYVPLFAGASEVVDLGCGRGEFLLALTDQGIPARGVDINPAMVERCQKQGLAVERGEALEFLAGLPDASLGGIFAAQVVEHLQPEQLVRLLDLGRAKLRTGGRIVLETVNPACWAAFFSSYIRDITHARPIHPDTLRYLLVARGFRNVDIRFASPYPQAAKLRRLPLTLHAEGGSLAAVVEEFNRNVDLLNGQLFTYMDYAAIGERG